MPGKNNSGCYESEGGNVFHAHGSGMSDETIKALGAMADAAAKALEYQCPMCGNRWLHGMEWRQFELQYHCECGWKGTFDDEKEVHS